MGCVCSQVEQPRSARVPRVPNTQQRKTWTAKEESQEESLSTDLEMNHLGYPLGEAHYKFVNRIGSGSYGQVFRALCTRQNAQVEAVAVKVLDLEDTPCDIEEIFKEVHLLSMLQHKNITTYHAVFVSHHVLFIVMPLLSGGSCLSLMRATRPDNRGFEDESVIATILREVLTGLRYVHDNGIIHRDIKADNVLVSADGAISLADFGSATVYASSLRSFAAEPPTVKDGEKRRAKLPCKNRHYSFVGTPCWMAPEVGSGFLQAMTERLHFTDGAATIVDASRNLPADVYLHMAPTSRLPTEFEATSPSQSIAPVDDQLVMSIVEPEAENSITSLVDSHLPQPSPVFRTRSFVRMSSLHQVYSVTRGDGVERSEVTRGQRSPAALSQSINQFDPIPITPSQNSMAAGGDSAQLLGFQLFALPPYKTPVPFFCTDHAWSNVPKLSDGPKNDRASSSAAAANPHTTTSHVPNAALSTPNVTSTTVVRNLTALNAANAANAANANNYRKHNGKNSNHKNTSTVTTAATATSQKKNTSKQVNKSNINNTNTTTTTTLITATTNTTTATTTTIATVSTTSTTTTTKTRSSISSKLNEIKSIKSGLGEQSHNHSASYYDDEDHFSSGPKTVLTINHMQGSVSSSSTSRTESDIVSGSNSADNDDTVESIKIFVSVSGDRRERSVSLSRESKSRRQSLPSRSGKSRRSSVKFKQEHRQPRESRSRSTVASAVSGRITSAVSAVANAMRIATNNIGPEKPESRPSTSPMPDSPPTPTSTKSAQARKASSNFRSVNARGSLTGAVSFEPLLVADDTLGHLNIPPPSPLLHSKSQSSPRLLNDGLRMNITVSKLLEPPKQSEIRKFRASRAKQTDRELSSTLQRTAGDLQHTNINVPSNESDVDPVTFPFSSAPTKGPADSDEDAWNLGRRPHVLETSQRKEQEVSTTRASRTLNGSSGSQHFPPMFRRPVNSETTPRPPVHRKLAAVGYSNSVDIWSFGILCLELAFGKPPDYDLSPAAVIYNRLQLPAPGPDNYEEGPLLSKTFLDLVSRCLHKDPDRRPSAKQLLKHRYFKKARDAVYLREHLLDHLPPAYLGNQFTGKEADTPSVDITIVKNQRGSVMTRGTRGSELGIGSTMMQPMQSQTECSLMEPITDFYERLDVASRRGPDRREMSVQSRYHGYVKEDRLDSGLTRSSFADLRRERGGTGAEQPESSERRGTLNTPLSTAKAEYAIPA